MLVPADRQQHGAHRFTHRLRSAKQERHALRFAVGRKCFAELLQAARNEPRIVNLAQRSEAVSQERQRLGNARLAPGKYTEVAERHAERPRIGEGAAQLRALVIGRGSRYIDRVIQLTTERADVRLAFLRTMHMLDAPTALFAPTIIAAMVTPDGTTGPNRRALARRLHAARPSENAPPSPKGFRFDVRHLDGGGKMSRMAVITLRVNGRAHTVDVAPSTPLLYVLRNDLGLQGPRFGCGLGQCGSCAVIINGVAVRSCVTPCSTVRSEVTTLEGLAKDGVLHPVQRAWIDEQVPACGFCQNGQIMTAKALLDRNPNPTDAQIRDGMNNTLCRCMTYYRVQSAIKRAAAAMRSSA